MSELDATSDRHLRGKYAIVGVGETGIRPNFYMDVYGGGSSTKALIAIAMGVIEAGMCHTVAIYRAMNGYA